MRLIFVALTLAALLLSATCGSDQDTPTPTPSPTPPAAGSDSIPASAGESGTFEVLIKFLKHPDIEIPVGSTVVWDSTSASEDISRRFHTVTSGSPGDPDAGNLFDSGEITKGDLFSYTFNQVGEFPYFCKIFPQFMKAVVKVQ